MSYSREVLEGKHRQFLIALCEPCHDFIEWTGKRKNTLEEANQKLQENYEDEQKRRREALRLHKLRAKEDRVYNYYLAMFIDQSLTIGKVMELVNRQYYEMKQVKKKARERAQKRGKLKKLLGRQREENRQAWLRERYRPSPHRRDPGVHTSESEEEERLRREAQRLHQRPNLRRQVEI